MSFYDEIEKLFNADEVKAEFNIYMQGFKVLVINNYLKIITFSESEITIKCKGGVVVTVKGAKMLIKKLAKAEIVISGEILSIERIGG